MEEPVNPLTTLMFMLAAALAVCFMVFTAHALAALGSFFTPAGRN